MTKDQFSNFIEGLLDLEMFEPNKVVIEKLGDSLVVKADKAPVGNYPTDSTNQNLMDCEGWSWNEASGAWMFKMENK